MLRLNKTALHVLAGSAAIFAAAAAIAASTGHDTPPVAIAKEDTFVDYIFDPELQQLRDRWGRQPTRSATSIERLTQPTSSTLAAGHPVLRPSTKHPVKLTVWDLPPGPLTMALWICPDALALVAKSSQVIRAGNVLAVGIDKENHYYLTRVHDDRRPRTATASATVVPGRWQHLAATYDGTTLALYLDGKLIASAPCRGRKTSYGDSVEVLGSQADGRNPFHGLIASYAVYNRAFTPAEISTLSTTPPRR